jgi:tape measure domain-containing protein
VALEGLNVGSIFAQLGARFDPRGFVAFDSAAMKAKAAAAAAEAANVKAGRSFDATGKAAESTGTRLRNATRDFDGFSRTVDRWASRGVVALGGVGLASAALGVRFDSMRQNAELAFGTLLHSASQGKAMVADLVQFARTTPFDTPGVIKASQQLLAYGFEAKQVKGLLTDVGDAAAAMGDLSSERIGLIVRALGQMHTAGVLHQEELNQLTENGIRATQYVAEAYGMSVQQLRKAIQAGKVDAQGAITAIREGIRRDLGGAMGDLSQGFTGQLSQLKDTASIALGTVFQPLFTSLTGWLKRINDEMSSGQLDSTIQNLQQHVGDFADAMGRGADWVVRHWDQITGVASGVAAGFQAIWSIGGGVLHLLDQLGLLSQTGATDLFGLVAGLYAASTATRIMNAALNANPLVLIASLVVMLATQLAVLYQTNEQFRTSVDNTWASVRSTVISATDDVVRAFDWLGSRWDALKAKIDEAVALPGRFKNWVGDNADPGALVGRARGGRLDRPVILAGEEAPAHPEYLISTNPRDAKRSWGLVRQVVRQLQRRGVRRMASGGPIDPLDQEWGFGAIVNVEASAPQYEGAYSMDTGPLGTFQVPWIQPNDAERTIRRAFTTGDPAQHFRPPGKLVNEDAPRFKPLRDTRPHYKGITPQKLQPAPLTADQRFQNLFDASQRRFDAAMALLGMAELRAKETPSLADDLSVRARKQALLRARIAELGRMAAGAPASKRSMVLQAQLAAEQDLAGTRTLELPESFLTARQHYLLTDASRRHDSVAEGRLLRQELARTDAARRAAVARGDFTTADALSAREQSIQGQLDALRQQPTGYLEAVQAEAGALLGSGSLYDATYRTHRAGPSLASLAAPATIVVQTMHPASPRVQRQVSRAWAAATPSRPRQRRAVAI